MKQDSAVDVAVGVVVRNDGAVLLGQRPPGKPYAGWWEFPGGKLEAGESVHDALVRELDEELGLRVRASTPWVVRRFVYPHATVRLHFRRVHEFDGEPEGREGQVFAWRSPGSIDVAPLLPATVPVLGWLEMPRVWARSAAGLLGADAFLRALARRADEAAFGALVLDEPSLSSSGFDHLFRQVVGVCEASRVRLIVSERHALSYRMAARGELVGHAALSALPSRPRPSFLAVEVEEAAALEAAAACGAECIVAIPVRTRSAMSPRAGGVDVARERSARKQALGDCIARTGVPAYACERWGLSVEETLEAGAHGLVRGPSFWEE